MSEVRHLSWIGFQESIMAAGQQRVHRVSSEPDIGIYWNGTDFRIGLRIEDTSSEEIPSKLASLAFLECSRKRIMDVDHIDVSVRARPLWRSFYNFAVSVADRIAVEGEKAMDAILAEVECFGELLSSRGALSSEKQIGLFGELVVLERILLHGGPSRLESWIGPAGEPHDFRLGNLEFEVKTSLGTKSVHHINGFTQLVPSPDHELLLVSILLGAAGSGESRTLPGIVGDIEKFVEATPWSRKLQELLASVGYDHEAADLYGRKYCLRRPVQVVPVTEDFPRIDRDMLSSALGSSFSRIRDIGYELDVEGLGISEGDLGFPEELILKNSTP
jgi:hypothetical protein